MSEAALNKTNRRRARRQESKRSARVVCYGNRLGVGNNLAVSILDLSESGVRLRMKAPLEVGREVEVNLEGLGHRRPIKLPGKAVWCVALADGTWCVGVQFQRNLQYLDLLQLTNNF